MSYFKKTTANTAVPSQGNTANDTAVPADATDTIAAVRWSPVANHLAAASWDGKVRIYDVTGSSSAAKNSTDRSARGLAQITAEGPLFSCDWYKDGSIVAAVGADKKVHLLDAGSGQTASFAAHDAPIRSARFVDVRGSSSPVLATGSWDRTLRYWDLRADPASGPLAAVPCGERVYAMDSAGNLLVVATADRAVHLVDLAADPTRPLRSRESALAHQTRVIAAFPDGKGWGTASIEGRAAVNIVDEKLDKDGSDSFTFRCHRSAPVKGQVKVWAVNDMNFHPANEDIFTTAGSDGTFCIWNRKMRVRTKTFDVKPKSSSSSSSSSATDSKKSEGGGNNNDDVVAVTATAFSQVDGGKTFAYATGYDWSQGYARNSASLPTQLMLHPVYEGDLQRQQ